jgi:hypothetical protein
MMGESRRRELAGAGNGHVVRAKRIRVVPNIRIETIKGQRGVMLMLGEREPELAAGLTPEEARKLAAALVDHAEQSEREVPRIIVPGGLALPHPEGGL